MMSTAKIQNERLTECTYDSYIRGESPLVLTRIYDERYNLAVWNRVLSSSLVDALDRDLKQGVQVKLVEAVSVDDVREIIGDKLEQFSASDELVQHIYELVEMFSLLFDLKRVGLRLRTTDSALCPRFHVDKVGCRLVTAFVGAGTEWLENRYVNRSLLGKPSITESDLFSGSSCSINNIDTGHVALLKGEQWEGNEGNGIVHRSPTVKPEQRRLLMTLDIID
ncbi:DUF1826 domain-containing protein [Vibrio sp.]|nr:DUF1826 domain-containing protein [Vibrio sp.]